MQCARPVKKFFLSNSDLCFLRDEPMEERERYSFTYNSGRMCHGKYTFNRFFLHDIRGNFGLLIGGDEFDNVEDRENAIWSFFLSEDYLFLVCEIGYGVTLLHFMAAPNGNAGRHQSRWTVYKTFMEPALERQAGRKFPCNPCMVRIEKNTLAMFGVTLESGFHVCCIYIWDLSADQIYRINNIGVIWLWHMDVDDNRLVTFEMNWRKQPPMVRQTKWTLTGQRLDRKQFPLPLSASFRDRLSEKTRFRRQDDCVSHTFGHKTVTRLVSDQEPNIMLDLIYDYATDKLSLRCVDHDASLKDNSFFNNPCPLLTPYISYQWDNQLGQLHVINTANGSSHMHPYQRDCREITDSGKVLMGNNEVLFLLSVDGIQIWIFNPNFDFDLELGDPFIPMEASG